MPATSKKPAAKKPARKRGPTKAQRKAAAIDAALVKTADFLDSLDGLTSSAAEQRNGAALALREASDI